MPTWTGPEESRADALAASLPEAVRLEQSCSEAFPDREPLGQCSRIAEQDGVEISIVARFYSTADVLESDRSMRECLQDVGGQWTAVDRDGPVARRARRDELLRAAGEARRALR
ncbi:MAG: hypothetical protein SangKO_075410 [Sandaracinaceae bacterium]